MRCLWVRPNDTCLVFVLLWSASKTRFSNAERLLPPPFNQMQHQTFMSVAAKPNGDFSAARTRLQQQKYSGRLPVRNLDKDSDKSPQDFDFSKRCVRRWIHKEPFIVQRRRSEEAACNNSRADAIHCSTSRYVRVSNPPNTQFANTAQMLQPGPFESSYISAVYQCCCCCYGPPRIIQERNGPFDSHHFYDRGSRPGEQKWKI